MDERFRRREVFGRPSLFRLVHPADGFAHIGGFNSGEARPFGRGGFLQRGDAVEIVGKKRRPFRTGFARGSDGGVRLVLLGFHRGGELRALRLGGHGERMLELLLIVSRQGRALREIHAHLRHEAAREIHGIGKNPRPAVAFFNLLKDRHRAREIARGGALFHRAKKLLGFDLDFALFRFVFGNPLAEIFDIALIDARLLALEFIEIELHLGAMRAVWKSVLKVPQRADDFVVIFRQQRALRIGLQTFDLQKRGFIRRGFFHARDFLAGNRALVRDARGDFEFHDNFRVGLALDFAFQFVAGFQRDRVPVETREDAAREHQT